MKITERFTLKKDDDSGKVAIRFRLHEKNVLVYPLSLYETLWDCYKTHYFCVGVRASFQIFHDTVCGYFNDDACGYYEIDYSRDAFIESAKSSLNELCHAVMDGHESYFSDFTLQTATQMLKGLDYLIIPQNYSQLFSKDVNVEDFSFSFTEPYSCDTPYILKIGNRCYDSCLSDWSTDFNQIRLELENFLTEYEDTGKVKLHYEASPTVINLDRRNVTGMNHGDLVKVTICPDEFSKVPILFGWCKPRQLVRSLYLGLLELCIKETDWFEKDSYLGTWEQFRLATYNKLQSCAIEDYINNVTENEFSFNPRQRVIHSMEDIIKDFQNLQNTLKL